MAVSLENDVKAIRNRQKHRRNTTEMVDGFDEPHKYSPRSRSPRRKMNSNQNQSRQQLDPDLTRFNSQGMNEIKGMMLTTGALPTPSSGQQPIIRSVHKSKDKFRNKSQIKANQLYETGQLYQPEEFN